MSDVQSARFGGRTMTLPDLPDLLTLEQAADFLRIDVLSVRRAAVAGELAVVRSEGRYLVDTNTLLSELGVPLVPRGRPQLSLVDRRPADVESPASRSPGTLFRGYVVTVAAPGSAQDGRGGPPSPVVGRPKLPAVLDLPRAVAMLGVARTTAYKVGQQGRWPHILRIGRLIKVPAEPLLDLLAGTSAPPTSNCSAEAARVPVDQTVGCAGVSTSCASSSVERGPGISTTPSPADRQCAQLAAPSRIVVPARPFRREKGEA